ncbi:MAG: thiamine diphosphokinase [Oscillospiraceae bacterium]
MRKICYIVGAGDGANITINLGEGDMVIAADGGYKTLMAIGITPDLVVGDFDSLGYIPEGVELVRHPPEKDDTDMMLAILLGMERGYRNFLIYGGLGGRLDHTLANLQSLCYIAGHGCRGWLWGDGTAITAVKDGAVTFPGKCSGMLSVFAQGGAARGVYETGLKYKLDDATLHFDYPLGISNEFLGCDAGVSVREGMLALLWHCHSAEIEQMIREGLC